MSVCTSVRLGSERMNYKSLFCFFLARQPPSRPGPPDSRCVYITHNDAPHSVGFLWISDQPVAETLPNIQRLNQTCPCPDGIRTYNLSRLEAADLHIRPRGHQDLQIQWKPLIMITFCHAFFDNNNRLITLAEDIKICIM
jgi:hypothetical protein